MNYPITRTKVILPRRHQDLLSRPRLLALLDDLLEYRLTLITAPAGYGKTSLLVDLAAAVEYPICWLAIDPLDEDPLRFLHYFVAAVNQVFPEFGAATSSLLIEQEGGELEMEQILRTVVNDLYDHVQEHFALVLDDYHLVDHSPGVIRFVNDFVQAVDENCHLVIASRTLTSLPDLPLMVGRSFVKGLSFDELAFLPEEIQGLYRVKYQQEISSQEAENLAQESEGWVTGLLLSAESTRQGLTKQGRAVRAAGIDLYDYLAQQVLDQQSPAMQDFLLRTSLLDEFNLDLCRQALGDPEGERSWKELIGELLDNNLFIQPVENGGTWLRYHHLFRDFLQHRYRTLYPDQAQELLRKLVGIYQAQGWLESAYSACQVIGDDSFTASFLDQIGSLMLHRGQLTLLRTWLESIPVEFIEGNPSLLLHLASVISMSGDSSQALRLLNQLLEGSIPIEDPNLLGKLLTRRATCKRFLGSYEEGLGDAEQALGVLQNGGNLGYFQAGAEHEIGLNLLRLGSGEEARIHLERSLNIYLEHNDSLNAAYLQVDLGLMEMNNGNYLAARSYYHKAYGMWEEIGNFRQLFGLCNNLGVLDHLTGEFLEAFNWFSEGLDYAHRTSNKRATAYTLASLGDLALDLGALSPAETYIYESEKIANDIDESFLQTYLTVSRATLARRRGDLGAAGAHLEQAAYRIGSGSRAMEEGSLHLERGWLLAVEGKKAQAIKEFKAALEVFSGGNLSVETGLALLALTGISCQEGDRSAAVKRFDSFREITRSLGTLSPFIPTLSAEQALLSCLEDHLTEDPLVAALVLEVKTFRTKLPELLGKLAARKLPIETAQRAGYEIQALGRMVIKMRGEVIDAPEWTKQRAVRELFFYLLSCPEGVSREEICLEFWPDSDQSRLQKQFKNTVYKLRRAVGKEAVLYDQTSRLYSFNRTLDFRYDVEEFQLAVQVAEEEPDPERRTALLERAAELYRDPFAPEAEGTWAEAIRYQLYLEYERVSLQAAIDLLASRKPEACLERAEKLLVVTPGQEEAWRLAMQAYGAKSDRAGVERTYQRCSQALAENFDTEPSPATQSLYRDLMA